MIVGPTKHDWFFTDMHLTFCVSKFLLKNNNVANTNLENLRIVLFYICYHIFINIRYNFYVNYTVINRLMIYSAINTVSFF